MQKEYFVYILASISRKIYTGFTNDLFRRVHQHRSKTLPGFTDDYNIFKLVYFEKFYDVNMAIAREKQIKGYRREKKVALIEKENKAWRDLAHEWYP